MNTELKWQHGVLVCIPIIVLAFFCSLWVVTYNPKEDNQQNDQSISRRLETLELQVWANKVSITKLEHSKESKQ